MNRQTSWIATLLMAVAAVLGFKALPARKGVDTSGADKARTQSAGSMVPRARWQSAPDELKNSVCSQIEKSVLVFVDQEKYAAPDSCLKKADFGKFKPGNPTGSASLRFVITTLPDPAHTHFPMLFDRLTEALQQAAQDQGYNYDSSWLPWSPDGRNAVAQKDSHGEDQQGAMQAQPGVLVFRKALSAKSEYCPPKKSAQQGHENTKSEAEQGSNCVAPPPYDAGLIVFVVGENPTGGIDQDQLQNAFAWIDVLGGVSARQRTGVLGPYFSGSLPSLYEGMLANKIGGITSAAPGTASDQPPPTTATAAARPAKTFAVFSGSVSSKAAIDWFSTQVQNSSVQFFSFQQNDDHLIDNYCLYLRNQGYDTGKLAIISEDETAYGFSPAAKQISAEAPPASGGTASLQATKAPESPLWLPDCDSPELEAAQEGPSSHDARSRAHGPLYVYYPRDIAALRSAYDRQQQGSGASSSSSTAAPALPFDLAESSSRERDTITSFGEAQTTLSQEATLFGISNLFKAHDIQFIVLRSSNTLDQVFLANFFARTDPSARVVLTNADLLFRRSSETAGFRGTMTLTTYPLLTWQQDWTHWQTPESRHSHRAFPEDTAEGLYLAARFLIDLDNSPTGTIPDGTNSSPLVLKDRAIEIQDYAPPSWLLTKTEPAPRHELNDATKLGATATPTRPPTWLSVVGSGQLWPVAVMGENIPEAKGPLFYPGSVTRATRSPDAPDDTLPWVDTDSKAEHLPDFQLPFPMFLCCVVVLAWSVWHFFCCVFGSHTSSVKLGNWKLSPSSFRSLAYFAPVPRRQHKWLIFIGCLITWLLAVEIAAATGVLHGPPYALENPARAIWYCILLGMLPWGALLANYRTYLPPKWEKEEPDPSPSKAALSDGTQAAQGMVSPERNAGQPRYDTRLMGWGSAIFALAAVSVFWIFHGWILASLGPGAKVFAMWRSINLFTGVSATAPLLLLTAGLYGWFWYSLSGLALFNAGIPKLPRDREMLPTTPMYSREGPGKRIQDAAIPLKGTYGRHFLLFSLAYFAFWQLAGDATSIRALGPTVFGKVYAVWFGLLIVLTLTETWQMLRTWGELRELLAYLDRIPLRRTLQALGGISWGTVWKMSGNVLEQRYRLISRQMESLRHLENELALLRRNSPARASVLAFGQLKSSVDDTDVPLLYEEMDECGAARDVFVHWYADNYKGSQYGKAVSNTVRSDLSAAAAFQKTLASTAAVVLRRLLLPAWQSETASLILEPSSSDKDKKNAPGLPKDEYVRAAEEFFCLPYLGFIQNILGRIRTMTLAIIWLFVAATLSVASYPFDPRPVLSGIFLVVFLTVAAVMVFVYAEMHRDPTLSHITNTNPGELGADFWMKLITFGIGPLLGLLTALFPDITGFVTSWLQPAVGSIK